MLSRDLCERFPDHAQWMLDYFVAQFSLFHKGSTLGYNIHNLLHVVDDERRHGTADSFSAYKFENGIRMLGMFIRKSSLEGQQVYNRITEYNKCYSMIKSRLGRRFRIDTEDRNSYFLLNNGRNIKVVHVIGDCRWSVMKFSSPSALFSQPLNSLVLRAFLAPQVLGQG